MEKEEKSTVEVSVTDSLRMNGSVKIKAKRAGETIAFRESEEGRRASSADLAPNGSVISRVQGPPTEGEEDSLRTAQVLREALNAEGGDWLAPDLGPVGTSVDCVLKGIANPAQRLEVQIVRAVIDSHFYRVLRKQELYEETGANPDALAHRLREAIASKSNDRRLAAGVRKNLVLALDATRVSALSLPQVPASFRANYREWARQQGFKAVWLVGPTATMTFRLDE